MCIKNKPHKWAKEIKAWADGAEIECREYDTEHGTWKSILNPNWTNIFYEYRIKPSTIDVYQYLYYSGNRWNITYEYYPNMEEAKKALFGIKVTFVTHFPESKKTIERID
jgi:hypothetical protein